jgi:hypothetical protein
VETADWTALPDPEPEFVGVFSVPELDGTEDVDTGSDAELCADAEPDEDGV